MRCWSCGKQIADDAVRCEHCEADILSPPAPQDMEMAHEFIQSMDPEMRAELFRVFQSSESGEEFINRIMVGECPECGSEETDSCEHDPDIDDVSIGRCFSCGNLWCTICDSPFDPDLSECPFCAESEDAAEFDLTDSSEEMNRYHLLAAEIFGYSFANYRDHLNIGHIRYEKLMPEMAQLLEQAVRENWSPARVFHELGRESGCRKEDVESLLNACRKALEIVDAPDAAESFRAAVRQSVNLALEQGLNNDEDVEDLVEQVCYRASDLSVLLEIEKKSLSNYSEQLRRERASD